MDQSLESPFEAPSPPREQVPATSLEKQGQLDDVIEGIERLTLEDNEAPSHKIPKWAMKTLESVHLDEIGKTRTRSSTRQDDGGNAEDSISGDPNSSNNMEASFDCELNLSANIEATSFEEVASHDECKESMHKEYESLIKKWDTEVGGPFVWEQTNWMKVGIQEQV